MSSVYNHHSLSAGVWMDNVNFKMVNKLRAGGVLPTLGLFQIFAAKK